MPEWLLDVFTAETFDVETGTICCPSCGTLTDFDAITPDPETRVGVCPSCR